MDYINTRNKAYFFLANDQLRLKRGRMTFYRRKKTSQMTGFFICGGRGRSRTCDRLVRSQVLYPAELRVRNKLFFYISSLGDNEHAS